MDNVSNTCTGTASDAEMERQNELDAPPPRFPKAY